ncbi:MAG: hypothetical protein KJZ57_11915, partial [Anaerolineales bacterium]|nr:hypothetical protein [Anaerolineales bacterium]
MKRSQKLSHLLRLMWNNPIFGDSYPLEIKADQMLAQVDRIYSGFQESFRAALKEGLPDASPNDLDEIVNQVGPKSVAFCASISAGELKDTERLQNAAVAIAVLYWADQSMDRGDDAMVAAVQRVAAETRGMAAASDHIPGAAAFRRAGLRHIERMVRKLNEHPEDTPHILRAIYLDILDNEARVRNLSREYFIAGLSPSFW